MAEYTALYRKFRPKTFSEILGQEHITTTLKNQVLADRVGHAYLFTGPRGCGKTSAAKVLARAVNCLNPKDGEPCNECEICKQAMESSLTDIVELDAASNNGVDNIRAIRDEVSFLPTTAKYRVYIIDEVHMLSTGAFNALLKTLEEPPKHVKFILATTEPQKIPATILSRCQRFDFKKITEEDIEKNLKIICEKSEIKYTPEALKLIAELADGAMRDGLSILERCAQDGENNIDENKIKQLVGIPETKYISNIVSKIIENNPDEILQETEKTISDGRDINNLIWQIIKYVKDIMLYKSTAKLSNIYNEEDTKEIEKISKKVDNNKLLNMIYELSKLENDIKWSTQKSILFQVGILKLCNTNKQENTILNNTKIVSTPVSSVNKKAETNTPVINKSEETPAEKNKEEVKLENTKPSKLEVPTKSQTSKSSDSCLEKVIETLKEERKPMLYTSLAGAEGKIIDDMTYGIFFPQGISSFNKAMIEKPENMQEIRKIVSIECKKDMIIKIIENNKTNKSQNINTQNDVSSLNLGVNINIIE